MEELEREMEAPGFWDDPQVSNQKMKEFKSLKDTVETCNGLSSRYEDIETLIEMGYEEQDPEIVIEVRQELDDFISILEEIRISTLLSGEFDKNNVFISYVYFLPKLKIALPYGSANKDFHPTSRHIINNLLILHKVFLLF